MRRFVKIMLILLSFTLLLACAVACGEQADFSDDASASSTVGTESVDKTSSPSETSSDGPYVPPAQSTPAATLPTPDTEAPRALLQEGKIVPEDGIVSLDSHSYISGSLLVINEFHPFCFNPLRLPVSRAVSSSVNRVPAHNLTVLYGQKSKNYQLANANLLIKEDAFPYLEALMNAFTEATGETYIQLVNGYVFSDANSLQSPFVTGYSIAINIYDGKATYPLHTQKVTAGGVEMTALEWFRQNAAQYGFIYTGLSGQESTALATFRFVGLPHAQLMENHNIENLDHYANFVRMTNGTLQIKDADGVTWSVIYCPAETVLSTTSIRLPAGAVYTVSGDNIGGFIVAYHT